MYVCCKTPPFKREKKGRGRERARGGRHARALRVPVRCTDRAVDIAIAGSAHGTHHAAHTGAEAGCHG